MGLTEGDRRRFACVAVDQRGAAARIAAARWILDLSKCGQDDLADEWRHIGLGIDRIASPRLGAHH